MFLVFLLSLPRPIKRIIMLLLDTILIVLAYWGAFWVRLDVDSPFTSIEQWVALAVIIPPTLLVYVRLGLYRTVLRYVSAKIVTTVMIGVILSSGLLVLGSYFLGIYLPRTVAVMFFVFSLVLICGSRLFFRMLLNYGVRGKIPVVIYGAGASGRQLLPALMQASEYFPIAFIDDNPKLNKAVIHGVTVYPSEKLEYLIERYGIKKVLLAMPSVSQSQRRAVVAKLENLSCEVLSIPGMSDLVEGRAQISSLKKVSIEELLGRDPVEPDKRLLAKNITGKVVMVTGAGGSIGSELCRQIIVEKPKLLILFDISEFSLYSIENEIAAICKNNKVDIEFVALLGSVQSEKRLVQIMSSFQVNTVYHAAAYKHVPLVENNVIEGVRNNIFGTLYCAKAAIKSGVEKFVLISTDKAVRPTNTMGATKRMAELVLQALSKEQNNTKFCMVRFGNVLGSSGSVVPLFKKQIAEGGPVTLTHKDIIRYFMTIPEAAQLVIQAGAMGQGGDVFVLDMGDPVKIIDLAKRMINLSGLSIKSEENPDGDIAIEILGLRPGEKLYEELLIGESVQNTHHPRIMTATEVMLEWDNLNTLLNKIEIACNNFNYEYIRSLLIEAPAGFQPTDGICDIVWQKTHDENAKNTFV
ncbi:polysaccharide biosynthesis protein [Yersinia kristensenii]|uniref:polysaccharide biosynthesis protein n=2 Tax=Yersinia kristensenii TaxID=28152 RepID=UPI0009093D14|nr:nucleoside-diphosphate sugar epimerase/dehydratase [Yersinia kristensenii]MDA5475146.1 nucleoside-diphosphate sugar epimerase/dehydratase [Yersinia kristensenii]MDA5507138.1 nucleoside-diphosphate sugar epimerase/dehydratase [Yersinia kristensenii]MDX6735780.1 nucleoside-diphosphate sugar epimerase/dehydratase [Yersinia kristensenii]NIK96005.1 polysaccharide biosynthesis protein [Yersinia kristensenii]NIL09049.1 polysaccharide biosynthesis protein [Yersinia kristensenii]